MVTVGFFIRMTMLTVAIVSFGLAAHAVPKKCSAGQVSNALTKGHCCWKGQTWSTDEKRCVGLAECPKGLRPSSDGEHCVDGKTACEAGRVRSGEGCCWPGQTWKDNKRQCVGLPKCPTGSVARGYRCLRLPPRPRAQVLPYSPVADGDYVSIKPGAFTQGSPRREAGRYRNERAFTVALSRHVLFKRTEVTQSEWRRLVPHNPSYFSTCGDDCPVERVNWYEALEWLNRLSKAEGLDPCYRLTGCSGELGGGCRVPGESKTACNGDFVCSSVQFAGLNCSGYRLPTEAEWEYAARAGTTEASYAGPVRLRGSVGALTQIAWFSANSQIPHHGLKCSIREKSDPQPGPSLLCGTHPVGQKKPNPWGIHDALGNVMEWVWDGFGTYPVKSKLNPQRDIGIERVVRGGSWQSEILELRAALRSRMAPSGRNARLGFRAARTVLPPKGKARSLREKDDAKAPIKPSIPPDNAASAGLPDSSSINVPPPPGKAVRLIRALKAKKKAQKKRKKTSQTQTKRTVPIKLNIVSPQD